MPLDEHRGAGSLGDDLAEEVRHRGDVAVDALDQLAGRVGAVELVVETEHVARHRETKVVGRPPRGDGGEPRDDDRDELCAHGDRQEDQREARDLARSRAVGGGVDDAAHHQRTGDRERRPDRHEHAEADPTPHVGSQQRTEGTPTRTGHTGLRRHRISLAADVAGTSRVFRRPCPSGPDPKRQGGGPTGMVRNICVRNEVDAVDGCSPTQPRSALRPRRRRLHTVLRRRARFPGRERVPGRRVPAGARLDERPRPRALRDRRSGSAAPVRAAQPSGSTTWPGRSTPWANSSVWPASCATAAPWSAPAITAPPRASTPRTPTGSSSRSSGSSPPTSSPPTISTPACRSGHSISPPRSNASAAASGAASASPSPRRARPTMDAT